MSHFGFVKYMFSQSRIIFSAAAPSGPSKAEFALPRGIELVRRPGHKSGLAVAMLFGAALHTDGSPRSDADSRPSLLYFYGNGMTLATALGDIDFLRRAGANMLTVELPGYGLSAGRPTEAGCGDAADTGLAYLRTRTDIDPAKILAAGWSLGGAIAIDLASRTKLAGLVTFSTFTSIANQANHWFPVLPEGLARPFLFAQFASDKKIARVKCPIFIGHGRHDHTVPFRCAARLRDLAEAPVTYLAFDAGHNDKFDRAGRAIAPVLSDWLDGIGVGETEIAGQTMSASDSKLTLVTVDEAQ